MNTLNNNKSEIFADNNNQNHEALRIQRLKEEKSQFETEYYDYGYSEGEEWAKSASYAELRNAIAAPQNLKNYDDEYDARKIFYGHELSETWVESFNEDQMLRQYLNQDSLSNEGATWFQGWIDGVCAFCNVEMPKINFIPFNN